MTISVFETVNTGSRRLWLFYREDIYLAFKVYIVSLRSHHLGFYNADINLEYGVIKNQNILPCMDNTF